MNRLTQNNINNHMISQFPREACGLLLESGDYYPCENTASGEDHFRISGEEWSKAEDLSPVVGVVHSHPNSTALPSESDRVSCEATEVPWYIYSVHMMDGQVSISGEYVLHPSGYQSPLVGRPFEHGTLDCLTIILDYYRREMGIDLGNYPREDGWWDAGKDYYRELLPKAGFVRVPGDPEDVVLQKGDVVLMQIKSPVPNHAGIYLGEKGVPQSQPNLYAAPGSILHHLYGFDSKRDVYGGYWLKVTTGIWRYNG
jgi:proteasome lid subunit RPN8/RPN11